MSKKSEATATVEGEEAPKKSKKKLIIIVVVLLLVVGYVAKGKLMTTTYKAGQKVPAGTIFPLPQLTVNLSDGHMVQVTVALQLTAVADSKVITSDTPELEDAATTVFGNQTYNGILTPAGRDATKAAILKECQKILGTVDGAAQQVTSVYYEGFVVQ